MVWVIHSDWLERQFDGTDPLDLDGVGDTINLAIVTDAVVDPDTVPIYPGALTPVDEGGTAWTGPVALANKVCGLDGSEDLVFNSDDPATIAQDGSGFTDGETLILYGATNGYILCHFTAPSAFGNVSGPLTIDFATAGIWKLNI